MDIPRQQKGEGGFQVRDVKWTKFFSEIDLVHQLNPVDGETHQSLLPQPSVGQFELIKWVG